MKQWSPERVAQAAGASIEAHGASEMPGPSRASIDSRATREGELFVGLPGEHLDGGRYAAKALSAGAWGVLVAPEHVAAALVAQAPGAVLCHPDPLAGLQALARGWRAYLAEHGTKIVAITGSTGKTSTKDILSALLAGHMRTAATHANLNTEIGLPLTILQAGADTEALVLELAMRGSGQIAELTEIAAPDVGVIVNVGAAHLELLGTIEAIAAAKAELITGMAAGATVVVPAAEPLLDPHLRGDLRTITFGEGGDVRLIERRADGTVAIAAYERQIELRPSFSQAHNLRNLLAAVAAAGAIGVTPSGPLEVSFSAGRGTRLELAGGVLVIDDCYNANPMSMRAAIDELVQSAAARRVAVLGDMLELGVEAPLLHREIASYASASGVDLLITVGPLAGEMSSVFARESHSAPDARAGGELAARLLRDGDTVLVKGSRGVGLELVVQALRGARQPLSELNAHTVADGAGAGRS
jgi:UDP-N-acetylmuramoyl-tripeptide--D-alanyl-D-alanine ligase